MSDTLENTGNKFAKLKDVKKVLDRTNELKGDIEQLKQSGGIVITSVEPMDDDIPKVFIDGNIPTTKDDVMATMRYVSKTDEFFAYIKIKCQGTSSMSYPKKNFTVKLYSDEAREAKFDKLFKDWKYGESKFVLKANYIDHSHARNIVSARLWNEVVASRSNYASLPEELKTSPKHGAIDGFPIKVYTNGTYQGIYTWNIGKDAWMWNMDEENPNHVLLCAETNTNGTYAENACNFRALWNGVDGSDWSVEVGTNSTSVKNSLNALIACIKDMDDETFKSTIENYLDIQSAIDYYIHQYIICGLDGLAKNMLLGSYDLVKWYCGAYDMDSTFGLWWDGSSFVSTSYACPEEYQEQFSLLWERIEKVFVNELKERYSELRQSVYSISNMFTHFERFMDVIGSDLYEEDLNIYTGIPSGSTNNIKQIRDYIRDRLAYCDNEFANMTEKVDIPATGITLDQTALSFADKTPVTLIATVEPSDTTDIVIWSSSNSGIATVSNGTITPITNGSCVITATAGNVSASCSVSVSGLEETNDVLYSMTEAKTFDGTSDYIDTGITLFDENTDFTITIEFTGNGTEEVMDGLFHCVYESDPWPGVSIDINNNLYRFDNQQCTNIASTDTDKHRIIAIKNASGGTIDLYWDSISNKLTKSSNVTTIHSKSLILGSKQDVNDNKVNFWGGIIHNCSVYNRQLTTDEITEYLQI